jgi:hypothetical protein
MMVLVKRCEPPPPFDPSPIRGRGWVFNVFNLILDIVHLSALPLKRGRIKGGGCKTTLSLFLFLFGTSTAQTQLLTHFHTVLQVGGIFPRDQLQDILDNQAEFGFSAASPYYGNLLTQVDFQYSLLDGDESPRALHYFKGGIGLAYDLPAPYLPAAGLGLSYYFVRSLRKKTGGFMFVDDNESEFGFYPFVRWTIPLSSKLFLQAGGGWDIVFTEPSYSHLPCAWLGLGWRWW